MSVVSKWEMTLNLQELKYDASWRQKSSTSIFNNSEKRVKNNAAQIEIKLVDCFFNSGYFDLCYVLILLPILFCQLIILILFSYTNFLK